MQRLELRALGSRVFIAHEAEGPSLAEVPSRLAAVERVASRFLPDSELSCLNASELERVAISRALGLELEAALDAARWTGGLVTPCVLASLEALGYDRSFDSLSDAPSGERAPVAAADYRQIELELERSRVRRPAGLRLDLSGTAKGRAADALAARLSELGPALVDAGGDIRVSGPRADGSPWPVGVADPAEPSRALRVLALSSGGVATSGRDFRRWRRAGGWVHHLIDPRTGAPASTDVLAATVLAPTAARADVAAKMLVLLGSRVGLEWLGSAPELHALCVLDGGQLVESPGFRDKVWS